MERLASEKLLPPHPVPKVIALPSSPEVVKIGHLNVRSYLAKLEDISMDECISRTDVMCFSETFLQPHQHVNSLPLNYGSSVIFRCDRPDGQAGGVMIACSSYWKPQLNPIQKHPSLEAVSVIINQQQLYIIAVYRRPQLSLNKFLSMFKEYLGQLPHSARPTIILGDFNENLLSSSPVSPLPGFMSALGFSQLMAEPTTDQGSLLDHIYYNWYNAGPVDVMDTYYSDHSACFTSVSCVSLT